MFKCSFVDFATICLAVSLTLDLVKADVYMHNPRGSNNRLDESQRERSNANRMFDSQNNNRGGYNVGHLYYLIGSTLQIEWTVQHSCNSPYANCEIVLQYMCDEAIRDGSDLRTIPIANEQCNNGNCANDTRFGMNENYDYYQTCLATSRNKGLFTADQNLRGNTAIYTRQNPNGNRYAYECPEERDYYPYWNPTKWIDIAVLTNDISRCDYYKKESENVKSRWFCSVPSTYKSIIPITKNECELISQAVWTESPSHGLPPPDCRKTQMTRDNYLGNTKDGETPNYKWIIPDHPAFRNPKTSCSIRIRYNISTNEFYSWSTYQTNQMESVNNNLYKRMGLTNTSAASRGYVFKNNPSVQIFSDLNFNLNLAINTAQYGRVFQDRSHAFNVKKAPPIDKNKRLINLNVRGKRGNIVQVYPAVEYDFVPNKLEISKNDYIHIQWTGSNTNPLNNDGQGIAGSDRSNIVLLGYRNGSSINPFYPLNQYGEYAVNYPYPSLQTSSFLGLSDDDLSKLAFLGLKGGSINQLDDAAPYFDLENPRQITNSGVYHYMCTRNNNFSNRDQKGEIIVYDYEFADSLVDSSGTTIFFENGQLELSPGTFNDLTYVRIDIKTKDQIEKELSSKSDNLKSTIINDFDDKSMLTKFVVLKPIANPMNLPATLKLNLKRSLASFQSASVYKINSDYTLKTKIDYKIENDQLTYKVQQQEGGIYVIQRETDYSLLIGLLIGLGLVLIVIGFGGMYFYKNPQYFKQVRYLACNAKRSMSNEI